MNCLEEVYRRLGLNVFISNPELELEPTIWRGQKSAVSKSFFASGKPYDRLKSESVEERKQAAEEAVRIFCEADRRDRFFEGQFRQAVSGDGSEWKRITTLHSSSLCSFAFFWNVERNPLKLRLEPEGEVSFTRSFFEVRNPVFQRPSNIDVVLTGTIERTGTPVVLYLESKFIEYIRDAHSGRQPHSGRTEKLFSPEYLKGAKAFFEPPTLWDALHLELSKDEITGVDVSWKPQNTKSPLYDEGVKQIVSHLIGIKNRLAAIEEGCREEERPQELSDMERKTGTLFRLGEIVFDFSDDQNDVLGNFLCSYDEIYTKMASVVNNSDLIEKGDSPRKFSMLPKLLRYSELKDRLNNRAKQFYFPAVS